MNTIKLFTDGSVNPQLKIGFGAYLVVDNSSLVNCLQDTIKIKKFENTSSTLLELQTLLWALDEINLSGIVHIYTDCQNILGLKKRCEEFEKNGYMTKSHKLISNHELYKAFYKKIKSLDCEFIKVKGHKKTSTKDEIDTFFTLVDKASRNALREYKACV